MRSGVDIGRFTAAVYDVPGQASWRVRIGGRYVLSVDGISPESGAIDLLEAHAVLAQEQAALADVRLVVAGPDPDPDYLAEFTSRAAGLGARPVRLGPVPDADLPSLVAGAAVLGYLPTLAASCASALEALAAGVPVVARDLPEVRAVLSDAVAYGDTVLSIADALVDMLIDPPDPSAGVELATAWAVGSEDGVVEEQPDRGDGRQD